nr:hypothetical protein [Tanacetum cinerariifolium]
MSGYVVSKEVDTTYRVNFLEIQTFLSNIQIQICESNLEPLNKQTTPNTDIFDIGYKQIDDYDDDVDDAVVFIPPFEVDPNLYEFISSITSNVAKQGLQGRLIAD